MRHGGGPRRGRPDPGCGPGAGRGSLGRAGCAAGVALALRSRMSGWTAQVQRSSGRRPAAADAGQTIGKWLDDFSIPKSIVMCESGGNYNALNPSRAPAAPTRCCPRPTRAWAAVRRTPAGAEVGAGPARGEALERRRRPRQLGVLRHRPGDVETASADGRFAVPDMPSRNSPGARFPESPPALPLHRCISSARERRRGRPSPRPLRVLPAGRRLQDRALAERAAALGMPALGLTDHGVMNGAVEFYKACRKHE